MIYAKEMLMDRKPRLIDQVVVLQREDVELRRKLEERDQRILELEAELKAKDQRIAVLEAMVARLTRKVFGKQSEKLSRPAQEIAKQNGDKPDPEKTKERRKKREELRRKRAAEVQIQHGLPEAERWCPNCPEQPLKISGTQESVLWEMVPLHFVRQVHTQTAYACPCCDHILTAQGPQRPTEGGQYGAGFMSHIVVSKCLDAIPFYRLEKQFSRIGIPISRSTLCDLFHQSAGILEPLYRFMHSFVLSSALVLADETPLPVLEPGKNKTRKGYIWTFLTETVAYYRFSPTRSGETPAEVLKNSQGTLVVDGYTGYNVVTTPETRERAGCWAHVRRKFFESRAYAPIEVEHILQEILELYRVEYEAVQRNIVGKPIHSQLRGQRSKPILDRIKEWLEHQRTLHLPQSPLGKAISYTLNQWAYLNHYLSDGQIPIDNNLSERRLRMIALGRKNYLFAGNDTAAQNLAMLQSLVVTCEMHGVNPEVYLTDVLIRVQKHPNKDIADLLPHRWKDVFGTDSLTESA